MDETRIPKDVERIVLLDPAEPKLLYKKKKKKSKNTDSIFRKSVRKAVRAMAGAQRDGMEMVADKVPLSGDSGGMLRQVGKNMQTLRRRGMKLFRLKGW